MCCTETLNIPYTAGAGASPKHKGTFALMLNHTVTSKDLYRRSSACLRKSMATYDKKKCNTVEKKRQQLIKITSMRQRVNQFVLYSLSR